MAPLGSGGDFEFGGTDRFAILRKLGSGGMGVVYQAFDRERNTAVALKALRYVGRKSLTRFQKEFGALAHLSHQNLVRMGELFCESGQWFFTMELVEGDNFLAHVRHRETAGFHEDRLRESLRQLAQGLATLHASRMVHRDIKPSNILITPSGRVVLLDFGLIAHTALDSEESEPTPSSAVVGTAVYMAPEQVAALGVGPEADWYSVGVVLYEALTGRLPFLGAPLEVLMNKQKYEPPPPRAVLPGVPTDLDSLCVELLRRDPKARPRGELILQRLGAGDAAAALLQRELPSTLPFVGRHGERALLREALSESCTGHAVAVLIEGPAGMGKASLVRAFTGTLEQEKRGVVTLAGRCLPTPTTPYAALDGVAWELAERLGRLDPAEAALILPPHIRLLARIFPVLERVASRTQRDGPRASDPRILRDKAWHAFAELLSWQASVAPLVVCLLDSHDADEDSLALLRHVLDDPKVPPLLLVLTSDGQGRGAVLPESFPSCHVRRIELGPLGEPEIRELVSALGPAPSEKVEAIATASAGHPLLALELALRASEASGTVSKLSLAETVGTRRATLDPGAKTVIDLLSVAGVPLLRKAVQRATGLPKPEWSEATATLIKGRWIRTGQSPLGATLEPPHPLVCAAIKDHLEEDVRKRLLGSLADSIATVEISAWSAGSQVLPLEALAGEEHAVAKIALWARRASEALAFHRAADLYQAALRLGLSTGEGQRTLTRATADTLASAGRGAQAGALYLQAAHGAGAAEALDLKRRAGEIFLSSGHADQALDVFRDTLAHLGVTFADTSRGALLSLLWRRARVRLRGLSYRRRDPSQVSALSLARIDVCWSIGAGLATIDYLRGADIQTHHLLLALDAGEPYRVARALAAESAFTAVSGGKSSRRTDRLVQSAQALAQEIGHPHAIGVTTQAAALAAQMTGRWKAARALCEKAITIFREDCTGSVWELPLVQVFHTVALAHLGELAELCQVVPRYLTEALSQGNVYGATTMRTGLSVLSWLAKGDAEGARREADVGRSSFAAPASLMHDFFDLQAQVLIDLYQDDGERARERVSSRWASLARSAVLRIQQVRISAHHLSACAALAAATKTSQGTTSHRQLLGVAQKDAARLEGEKMPWSDPLALLIRAGVDLELGQRERALSQVGTAAVGFEAADMALFAAVCRKRQGALLGGDKGAKLILGADAFLAGQGVRQPERMADMLAPGLVSR
jgi:hypothetical protein